MADSYDRQGMVRLREDEVNYSDLDPEPEVIDAELEQAYRE